MGNGNGVVIDAKNREYGFVVCLLMNRLHTRKKKMIIKKCLPQLQFSLICLPTKICLLQENGLHVFIRIALWQTSKPIRSHLEILRLKKWDSKQSQLESCCSGILTLLFYMIFYRFAKMKSSLIISLSFTIWFILKFYVGFIYDLKKRVLVACCYLN